MPWDLTPCFRMVCCLKRHFCLFQTKCYFWYAIAKLKTSKSNKRHVADSCYQIVELQHLRATWSKAKVSWCLIQLLPQLFCFLSGVYLGRLRCCFLSWYYQMIYSIDTIYLGLNKWYAFVDENNEIWESMRCLWTKPKYTKTIKEPWKRPVYINKITNTSQKKQLIKCSFWLTWYSALLWYPKILSLQNQVWDNVLDLRSTSCAQASSTSVTCLKASFDKHKGKNLMP